MFFSLLCTRFTIKMSKTMKKLLVTLFIIMAGIVSVQAKKIKQTMVKIETEYGNIVVKLYDETPLHRDNFLKLVNEGFYNDLLFHRVIKDFMIQGGDPESKGAPAGKSLGAGDVGYTIPAEFVYPKYYHKKGALAAARQADQVNPEKKSSGCQFYIVQGKKYNAAELVQMEKMMENQYKQSIWDSLMVQYKAQIMDLRRNRDQAGLSALQDKLIKEMDTIAAAKPAPKMPEEVKKDYMEIGGTPFLDNQYTVFGEVVEGLDVIDKIAAVETAPGDRPKKDLKMNVSIVK